MCALAIPRHPCVAIIGSGSFWDPESESTCREIGARLAEVPDVTLITGGIGGVGDTVGRSFYLATRATSGARGSFTCCRKTVVHAPTV